MDGEKIDGTILVKVFNIFDPSMGVFTQKEVDAVKVLDSDLEYLLEDNKPSSYVSEKGDFMFQFNGQRYWIPAKGNPDTAGYTYEQPYCFLNANIARLCADKMVDLVIMEKHQYDDYNPKSGEKIKVKGGRMLSNGDGLKPIRDKYMRVIMPDSVAKKDNAPEQSEADRLRSQIAAMKEAGSDDAFAGLNIKGKK